jgi:hypothetical protein
MDDYERGTWTFMVVKKHFGEYAYKGGGDRHE